MEFTKFVVSLSLLLALSLVGIGVGEGNGENNHGEAPESIAASEGVYTVEQADRGRTAYFDQCAECHGLALNGGMGPALKGEAFLSDWGNRSALVLYDYIHDNMPLGRAGGLQDETYLDILTHMLRTLGHEAGGNELVLDRDLLSEILVRPDSQ